MFEVLLGEGEINCSGNSSSNLYRLGLPLSYKAISVKRKRSKMYVELLSESSVPFRSDGDGGIHDVGRVDGWSRAGEGVVFVDVDPQRVLPDDRAGHRAGPGYDHPRIALGRPAAPRGGQLHQVGRVAVTRREGRVSVQYSLSAHLPQRVALRYLLLGEFTNNVNTVWLQTNRGVDGDIFAGAVGSVEEHGLLLPEVFQVLRLVAQRVRGETVSKADQAEGEVVASQPGDDLLELHAGPPRDVDDEVAQLLPVSGRGI